MELSQAIHVALQSTQVGQKCEERGRFRGSVITCQSALLAPSSTAKTPRQATFDYIQVCMYEGHPSLWLTAQGCCCFDSEQAFQYIYMSESHQLVLAGSATEMEGQQKAYVPQICRGRAPADSVGEWIMPNVRTSRHSFGDEERSIDHGSQPIVEPSHPAKPCQPAKSKVVTTRQLIELSATLFPNY